MIYIITTTDKVKVGRMLDAVKLLRQETTLLLKESLQHVEEMVAGNSIEIELTRKSSKITLQESGLFTLKTKASQRRPKAELPPIDNTHCPDCGVLWNDHDIYKLAEEVNTLLRALNCPHIGKGTRENLNTQLSTNSMDGNVVSRRRHRD